jgi:hypothetical protein
MAETTKAPAKVIHGHIGPLLGRNHPGWTLWIVGSGALLPAMPIRGYGIRQSRAVLEQVST